MLQVMTYMLGLEGKKKKDLDKFDTGKGREWEKTEKLEKTTAWLRNEEAQNLEYEVVGV